MTLRQHLKIHKKLSQAIWCEVSIRVLCLACKSVSDIFFIIFMLALLSFFITIIGSLLYRFYLKHSFGKPARRLFLKIEKKSHKQFVGKTLHHKSNHDPFDHWNKSTTSDTWYSNLSGNIYHTRD